MKKNIFIIIVAIFNVAVIFAQDRVNDELFKFSASSDTLKSAIGWAKNERIGKWIEHKNYIDPLEYNDGESPSKILMSSGLQNFTYIVAKKFKENNKDYVALIVEHFVGYYKYPSIKSGYNASETKVAYIFEEKEYNKLTTLGQKKELSIKVKFNAHQNSSDDEIAFNNTIKKSVYNNYYSDCTFPIMVATDGNIRFFLPNYHTKYSKLQFEKNYFEVPQTEFKKLLFQ